MTRKQLSIAIILLLSLLSLQTSVHAQVRSHCRVSLLTVGRGTLLWESLGHSCIRVVDSTRSGDYRDVVFNYGTLDYTPGFETELMKGDIMFNLSAFTYSVFRSHFVAANRSLTEQVMILNDTDKTALIQNLETNSLPANKYYRYLFFDDNCTTRIYDLFVRTFGSRFHLGNTTSPEFGKTAYDMADYYYSNDRWVRTGTILLFENRLKQPLDNACYFPILLSNGMENATIDNRPLCVPATQLQADTVDRSSALNAPFWIMLVLAALTFTGIFTKAKLLAKIMSWTILGLSSIVGILLTYAWLGTNHAACAHNMNLLWAIPTNILIPIFPATVKKWYCIAALILLAVVFAATLLHAMVLPIPEILPLLLALGAIYYHHIKLVMRKTV